MKKVTIILCVLINLSSWGIAQNGLNFDGEDDLVETEYAGVLGSEDRTFEAWIFVSSSAPDSPLAILDYGENAVGSRNTFQVGSNKEVRFLSGGTFANIGTADGVIIPNKWMHVAFVLDNGTGYIYVDGVEMGTGILSTVDTPSNGQNVRVGQRVNGGSIPFNGVLDEVRIWDVARTAEEIQATRLGELCDSHPDLKLYFQLNEGEAEGDNAGVTLAMDNSGDDNNGTLNNFSLAGDVSNWVNGSGVGDGSNSSSIQQTACDSFFWVANSTFYTTSGMYSEIFSNAAGCDSTVTLDLTINTVNTEVTQDGALLSANETDATYQWIECSEMMPIDGATNQSYMPTVNGDYAVIVTNDMCSDTSTCYTVVPVSTIENEFSKDLQLFPNPTNGTFSIDMGELYESANVTITDINGKTVFRNTYNNSQLLNLDLEAHLGVYLVIVEVEGKRAVTRLVRL